MNEHCWHRPTSSDPLYGTGQEYQRTGEHMKCCQCGQWGTRRHRAGPTQDDHPLAPREDVPYMSRLYTSNDPVPPCPGGIG